MADCIFCKIVSKEIPAEIIFETDNVLAFKDVSPLAPVHMVIIPKKHIASVNEFTIEDKDLIAELILTAQEIAKDLNISEKGYKLLFRTGSDGGQEVPHIHLHLIGGAKLYEEIRPVED